jgi:hypothetical protein
VYGNVFLPNDTLTFEILYCMKPVLTRDITEFMIGTQEVDGTDNWDENLIHHQHVISLGDDMYTLDNISMSLNTERNLRSIVQFKYDPLHDLHESIYFELKLVRTYGQEIGIKLAPLGYNKGMIGWQSKLIDWPADDDIVFDNKTKQNKAQ